MRAVIAEDSLLLRVGLVKVLEVAGFEITAEVGDAEALLAAVEEHRPGLALVDVRMPPGFTDEGVRAALVIRKQWPQTAVVLLSQYVEERYAADLLTANTSGVGYLLKQRVADVEEFVASVRRVAAGGTALDPQVVAQLLVRRRSDPLDRLTPREREVLALMTRDAPTPGSPRPWSSATAQWPSTSTTSSPNSACPQPTPTRPRSPEGDRQRPMTTPPPLISAATKLNVRGERYGASVPGHLNRGPGCGSSGGTRDRLSSAGACRRLPGVTAIRAA